MWRRWMVLGLLLGGIGCGGGGSSGGGDAGGSSQLLFQDDFNRANGDLGSDWQRVMLSGMTLPPPPNIESGRVASDGQGMVMVSRNFMASRVRVSCTISFDAASEAGVYVLADDDNGVNNALWIAGLDAEGDLGGTPVVARMATEQGVMGSPLGLQPGTLYLLEALFDNGIASLWVKQSDGTQLAYLQTSFPGLHPIRFGFMVGRQADGLKSYVDDFRIESED